MRKTICFLLALLWTPVLFGQQKDTVRVTPGHLDIKGLKKGNSAYIVYNKKSKTSAAERIVLVRISVGEEMQNGKTVISVAQQWELDTVLHSATTRFNASDFSTLSHESWWKRLGYTSSFDFTTRKVTFEGNLKDSLKAKINQDFQDSFAHYNLNWHSDLVIFPMLPYKENRVFNINFFDPGFGKATQVNYAVTGSDWLTNSAGDKVECWTLEHHSTKPFNGYQKFWISKKSKELLKEEDCDLTSGRYRYKLKLAVSEN
jgi:hypothetical protein